MEPQEQPGQDPLQGWVEEALASVPAELRERMSNVDVVVQDEPPPGQRLLGLYQGVPLTRRTSGYAWTPPDKITIFRGPIERMTSSPRGQAKIVRDTVVHEIAHHFGISDARLSELGLGDAS